MRLTDRDRSFGPLTFGLTTWRAISLTVHSHGGDEGYKWNALVIYFYGLAFRLYLPRFIRPYRKKVQATYWDAATIARMGRDWYWDEEPREYGFSLCDGHFSLHFGIQPGDSSRDQYWGCLLPWTQWRFIRFSLYQPDGTHFYTQLESERRAARKDGMRHFQEQMDAQEKVGKRLFTFRDFDGELITATTHIEEREWHFGDKWCSWLSYFRKPKIHRSLSINFSSEVGREKGSWKGGTLGHGIDMLPNETMEDAFRRYCSQPHRSKSGPYRLEFCSAVNV
jgi:hypothetical protein